MRMDEKHPRWPEFCRRLEGLEGCNFRTVNRKSRWTCSGRRSRPLARWLLRVMGLRRKDVAKSMAYFTRHGGYCDCEIIFNVQLGRVREKKCVA